MNDSPPPYHAQARINHPSQDASTVRRELTEHVFQLEDSRHRPWATLKLFSGARSSKSLPKFYELERINGTLELEGDSSMRSITIAIAGRLVTGARVDDIQTFVNIMHPIWSRSQGGPRTPSTSGEVGGSKLSGRCIWPFTISMPRTINTANGLCSLPETFMETGTDATIQYELTVDISRGMFRSDSRIRTAFGYVPCSIPEAPSLLRQLAHEASIPIPGPDIDVDGWKNLAKLTVHGLVAQSRSAQVDLTLSLAKPLSYTRGSVIPCFLKFSSDDTQALDMFRPGDSVKLSLQRDIKYHNAMSASRSSVAWNATTKHIGFAKWWSPQIDTSDIDHTVRYLQGEVRLPVELKPSAKIEHFSISYSLVLYPLEMTGFQTFGIGLDQPLVTEPVTIWIRAYLLVYMALVTLTYLPPKLFLPDVKAYTLKLVLITSCIFELRIVVVFPIKVLLYGFFQLSALSRRSTISAGLSSQKIHSLVEKRLWLDTPIQRVPGRSLRNVRIRAAPSFSLFCRGLQEQSWRVHAAHAATITLQDVERTRNSMVPTEYSVSTSYSLVGVKSDGSETTYHADILQSQSLLIDITGSIALVPLSPVVTHQGWYSTTFQRFRL
ncbi:hypothetical protein VNI00_009706 [Paramarasmius palmivorus]|uniref:Arrestin-like N-terminal domain-containing protein n=1 Tax=Paramarasmius palmivorus TaxID=297713 RepID=A0AAW0CNY8_9AGAR